jgi:hypothetical protein
MQRVPEYALTDEIAARLDQFFKLGEEPAAAVAEQQPAAVLRRVRYARQEPWFAPAPLGVSTVRVELARQTEPVLTGRTELEVSAGRSPRQEPSSRTEIQLSPRQEPALTARTEIQLSTREAGAEVGRPEVQNALVHALKPRAEAVPEIAPAPEIRQAIEWAQEAGRRLAELGEIINSPRIVQLLMRKELPKEERRTAIPLMPPIMQAEPPRDIKPWSSVLKTSEDEPKYNPPLLTQPTTPTTADVPPPPTYTPVTVPQISEVPTPDIRPVPTYDTYPTPQPEPLPLGWWRLLPPSLFTEDSKEGAYKVQFGKRQVLLLA